MDLEQIKAKLQQLNQDNSNSGNDYAKNFWNAPIGKSVIRVVPSAYNPNDLATELLFHNTISKYPVLALTNFGKQDPVQEFRALLQNAGGKENWSLSGKLTPRARYFVPVIVRGEEEKGVRLWSVGITMYKALLALAADDDIGDFTDVTDGCDIKVTKVEGNPYPETSIMAARNSSPLSTDAKQVEEWLKNQPEPIRCFREQSYEQIKQMLENFMQNKPAGQAVASVAATTELKAEVKAEPKPEPKPAPKKAPAKSAADQFDDLFGDETENKPVVDDDLPF